MTTLTAPLVLWIYEVIEATPKPQRASAMFSTQLSAAYASNPQRAAVLETDLMRRSTELFPGATYGFAHTQTILPSTHQLIEIGLSDDKAAVHWKLSHHFRRVTFL